MKYLWEEWPLIEAKIRQAGSVFFFLDYDGTLTPIVSRPELALCPPEVKTILAQLRDTPQVFLSVISGRSLEDIQKKVGLAGITYVGNHGLDMQNPAGMHKKILSPSRQQELGEIIQTLRESIGEIPGIFFEDKGSLLAVHYRNVARKHIRRIQEVLKEILAGYKGRWKTAQGKMVAEIQPEVDFHKGKAVKDLLKGTSPDLLPVYLGDDQSDEQAFREIKGRGITVLVGPEMGPSEAEYYLKNPSEVQAFLLRCAKVRRDKISPSQAFPDGPGPGP